jgi:hypothetical protein
MAPSDDEIPDLFPAKRAVPHRKASENKKTRQPKPEDQAPPLLDLDGPDENFSLEGTSEDAAAALHLDFKQEPSRPAGSTPASSGALELDFASEQPHSSASSPTYTSGGGPAFGGDLSLGDALDELEFGDDTAHLDVAIDGNDSGQDKETPWPSGRTPFDDEIPPSPSRARELSGFGEAPSSFLLTPMYAVRVYRGLNPLRKKTRQAERKLAQAEAARDEVLAEFAESKRAELSAKHRFAPLFLKVTEHEGVIAQRRQELQSSSVKGDAALSEVQTKTEAKKVEKQKKQKDRDQQQERVEEAERELARHSAALKRVDIQYRNLQARLERQAPGTEVPSEFEAQFQKLDDEKEALKAEVATAKETHRQNVSALKEADKHLARALAELQLEEGKKEALVISQEGEASQLNSKLELESDQRRTELADATRVILELKGEVPVPPEFRKRVITLDETVRQAFVLLQDLRLAEHSMNAESYGTGRSILIGLAATGLLLLAYSAL